MEDTSQHFVSLIDDSVDIIGRDIVQARYLVGDDGRDIGTLVHTHRLGDHGPETAPGYPTWATYDTYGQPVGRHACIHDACRTLHEHALATA